MKKFNNWILECGARYDQKHTVEDGCPKKKHMDDTYNLEEGMAACSRECKK